MGKCAIVLGTARTGTSMTAGMLYYLGVDMLNAAMWSHPANPNGQFEEAGFISITSRMAGGVNDKDLKEIKDRIRREDKRELWGFKSALTHITIEHYIGDFEDPRLIFLRRNFDDNVASFMKFMELKGGSIPEGIAKNRLARDRAKLEHFYITCSESIPKIRLEFEDVRQKPIEQAVKICNLLDISLTEKEVKKIDDFILRDYSTIKGG
jgi:hypothetical protein